MASSQWKDVERFVAKLLGGIRTWDTQVDVTVVTDPGIFPWEEVAQMSGAEISRHTQAGRMKAWAVEVKNWKTFSIPEIERILAYNGAKAERLGMKNALVIKRRAGAGVKTPYLLIVPLEVPPGERA